MKFTLKKTEDIFTKHPEAIFLAVCDASINEL
jgi:hypothetical protein